MATVETTLQPTIKQIQAKAAIQEKEVAIHPILCSDAYDYLMKAGDRATHDKLITEGVSRETTGIDLFVLAQASLAHLETALNDKTGLPVLSSPESAVEKVLGILAD